MKNRKNRRGKNPNRRPADISTKVISGEERSFSHRYDELSEDMQHFISVMIKKLSEKRDISGDMMLLEFFNDLPDDMQYYIIHVTIALCTVMENRKEGKKGLAQRALGSAFKYFPSPEREKQEAKWF